MEQNACNYFLNEGYSCSESVVMACAKEGLVPIELVNAATSFSGGMGTGCLCGAIAGAQMVIGYLHGKNKSNKARALAKIFADEFKKAHKATCCRVLSSGFEDFHSRERKLHCMNMVEFSTKTLKKILENAETTERP